MGTEFAQPWMSMTGNLMKRIERNIMRIPKSTQHGFTLIELLVVVTIMGILAAIAIPQLTRYQVKSRQAESRANLGGIFASQMVFFAENNRFGGLAQIGFSVAGLSNRYNYRAVTTDANGNQTPQPGDLISAVVGPITADNVIYPAESGSIGFTATATGNIDVDPTVDQWYVNDIQAALDAPTTNDVFL